MSPSRVAKTTKTPRENGLGTVRPTSAGFQARYREDGQQKCAPHTFKTREAAHQWLVDRAAQVQKGEWQDPRAGAELLWVYGERWIRLKGYTPRSRENAERLWRLHIEPHFGPWSLSKIKFEDVQEWRSSLLSSGVGAPTVRLAYNLLKAVLGTAVEAEKIKKNPCRIKGASTSHSPKRRYVPYEECMEVVEKLPPHLRPLGVTAWWTGGRMGEVLGLQWRDIDLATGHVHIRRQVVQAFGELHDTEPKWHSDRIISIGEGPGLDALRQHKAEAGRVFGTQWVFKNRKGERLTPGAIKQAWQRARVRAERDDVKFHDLRRSVATEMLHSGASLHDVQRFLGHENITTTMRYIGDDPARLPVVAVGLADHIASRQRGTASA